MQKVLNVTSEIDVRTHIVKLKEIDVSVYTPETERYLLISEEKKLYVLLRLRRNVFMTKKSFCHSHFWWSYKIDRRDCKFNAEKIISTVKSI